MIILAKENVFIKLFRGATTNKNIKKFMQHIAIKRN